MNKVKSSEHDRDATESRLITAVGQMIEENGFEKIGINAVAAKSGVSKILIYRYFGSMDGLVTAYIRRNDFWLNFPDDFPQKEEIPMFLKKVFHQMACQLRHSPMLKRLYRWELSASNNITEVVRRQREAAGNQIISNISKIMQCKPEDLAAIATIITSSITYLAMLEDNCNIYNGIELDDDKGWQQITTGIDMIIDNTYNLLK
jgi:AcrR family transcriptional regulator